MHIYTLNDKGQRAIDEFILKHGRPGLCNPAFYLEAESEAISFITGHAPILELSRRYSVDQNPHELRLCLEWFDLEINN